MSPKFYKVGGPMLLFSNAARVITRVSCTVSTPGALLPYRYTSNQHSSDPKAGQSMAGNDAMSFVAFASAVTAGCLSAMIDSIEDVQPSSKKSPKNC